MIQFITSNGTNQHHMPPDITHQGHNITSAVFLPKTCNLYLTTKKPQINTNRGKLCKTNGLHSSKMLSSQKMMKKKRNCFRLKESKEIEQLNAVCDNGLNEPCTEKLPPHLFFQGGWREISVGVLPQKTLLGQLIKF